MSPFRTIAAVVSTILVCPAGAVDDSSLVLGIGRQSCAYWQSSAARKSEGAIWIYGFWSAWNLANNRNHKVGEHSDTYGKVAEVLKTCAARPSMTLQEATAKTYNEMDK
jgi:hypothetical protein